MCFQIQIQFGRFWQAEAYARRLNFQLTFSLGVNFKVLVFLNS